MSVGAVIVSYGSIARARRCLESLESARIKPDHVVVVHNGPEIAGQPWVVDAPRNLGYSGGLRLGVQMLSELASPPDYLWMLNNDAVVHQDALAALVSAASANPSVGLWGCTICNGMSFSTIAAIGVRYSRWTTRRWPLLAGVSVSEKDTCGEEPSYDFIPGSSMFMRRDVYERCGGLSDAYFLYFEELDLAARVKATGHSTRWCRDALVAHDGGATTKSYQPRESRPPLVAYHAMRSAIIYTYRHELVALPAVIASRFLVHVCISALLGDWRTARAALRGIGDGVTSAWQTRAAH